MDIEGLKALLGSFTIGEINVPLILIIFAILFVSVFAFWLYFKLKAKGQQHLSHRKEWMIQQKKQ